MAIYTAFCQSVDGDGTIWIDTVEAPGNDTAKAIEMARTRCADDWHWPVENVHCLGLAAGDVEILHWEDLNDD